MAAGYCLLLTSFLSWILSLGVKIQVGTIPMGIAHKLLGEFGVVPLQKIFQF